MNLRTLIPAFFDTHYEKGHKDRGVAMVAVVEFALFAEKHIHEQRRDTATELCEEGAWHMGGCRHREKPPAPPCGTRIELEIGGKTPQELLALLEKNGHHISDYTRAMMLHEDFTTAKEKQRITLVFCTIAELGLRDGGTTNAVYEKAREYGLDIAPAEAGPHLRLQYTDQPMNKWVSIGMQQIPGPGGDPAVLHVGRYAGGSWLDYRLAKPDYHWAPAYRFAFRLRK